MIKTKKGPRRISQGGIYRDVEFLEYATEKSGIIEFSKILFPLVIVLTQDCDLEQDYKFRYSRDPKKDTQDKWLLSVLVAPLYNAEHVFLGQHMTNLNMIMQEISKGKSPGKFLRDNQLPRFHYVEFPADVPITNSIIDFKHYFSVNVKYLHQIRKNNFVCQVSDLYREDISQRFASFLSRIGLPEISAE
jgi:hypothetical protein